MLPYGLRQSLARGPRRGSLGPVERPPARNGAHAELHRLEPGMGETARQSRLDPGVGVDLYSTGVQLRSKKTTWCWRTLAWNST